ncbi:hypothetical protein [Armatimonas rosea]|uniref:Uncharacterized protein n=1 Tax=Armatimonas rosea TaxID=685828 RepID=A0A7W9SM84_ARMRO|nr:hypothetical protein [Armatimonas rosea]MBB6048419.1 hypothetical protein [Armatimonas rosea]
MRLFFTLALTSLSLPCLAQSGEAVTYGSSSSILCASLGFLTAVAAGLVLLGSETRTVGTFRVVAPPPGEEPEALRQAWVGLELPLRKHQSGSAQEGYRIDGPEAVRLLAAHNPAAAQWWHTRLHHGSVYTFPTETCQLSELPQTTPSSASWAKLSQQAKS